MKKIALAILLISSPAWAENTTSLSTGFDTSTGKYGGTTATSILYVPVTGKFQADTFFLKLTVPYIRISSVGGVLRGMGRFRNSTTTKIVIQEGLGDITTSAGYTVFENTNLLLDLVGNIKFGTADPAKNLGTGENDYSAQLDGSYLLDKATIFATTGYKLVGAPAGVTVNNTAYINLGLSYKTAEKTSVGLMLDAAQASNGNNPGIRELTVFISNRVSDSLKVQANLLKGFSDDSADFGGGLMITGMF